MIRVSVYSLEELAKLREEQPLLRFDTKDPLGKNGIMIDQIENLQLELGFLKMFLWCLPVKSAVRNSFVKATIVKSKEGLYDTGVRVLRRGEFNDWDSLISKLQEKFGQVKPRISQICLDLLEGSCKCKLYNRFRLLEFLNLILDNLRNLLRLKSDELVYVEMQIKTLEEKLNLFRDLVDFTTKRCTSSWELKKLSSYIQAWAYKAASLLFLFLIGGMQEKMASRLNDILLVLLQMIKPCTPEVQGMYFKVLKASKSSNSDNLLMGEIVPNVIDFLLESAVVPINESMKTLRDGLIILTTFLMNPPQFAKNKKLMKIWKQTDIVVTEAVFVISSLNAQQTNKEAFKENSHFHELLKKMDKVKARIKRFFVYIADASKCNFPRTNVLGFIDFLLDNLGNLKEKFRHDTNFIPFAKHQILTIQEELMLVRPFLKDLLAIQHKQKDLWMKITCVSYQADHLIDLCQTIGYPIWHTMISLSHISKEIKFIKSKVYLIRDKHRQTESFKVKVYSSFHHHAEARITDVIVGFEDEATTIIDKLTRGSSKLQYISIVGMPGIGKTTLAKMVYNGAQVQSYFQKRAWCVVSQSYERRELLLAILNDLVGEGFGMQKDEEDLAFELYKSLKQRRYLIVLDDIWDIWAWKELKQSFPNDENGSRIIFTSRIHNIALEPKSCYYAHPLRLLSTKESSKLLQEKLHLKDGIPSNLSQVAGQILKFCKGLPLSVVVVAGLLGQEALNLGWWKYIAEGLDSKLASERAYMDILQLSYKHLPDFLKPCFLYFGAFREDEAIKVAKLIKLWIAEGFILKDRVKSLENVAMDYLKELIDRSLVIVAKRNVIGEIKACQVHDLLREMCFANATGENFLFSPNVQDEASDARTSDQHRLCIHGTTKSSLELNFTSCSVRSLLISSTDSSFSRVLSMFKFLRVLKLEKIHLGFSLPPEITLLTHLRYLVVRCRILEVPSSIAKLENLETFQVLGSTNNISFPESIWMLKKLRHLDIGGGVAILALGTDWLEDTSQLDYLDSFSSVSFSSKIVAEEILGRIPRVRKLSISYSYWGIDEGSERFPVMDFLGKLESLKIRFVQKEFRACKFSFPSTLKKLTLSNFGRPWDEISPLGMLPNLEVLKLESDAFVGERWDVEDEQFLKLKYLKLKNLDIVLWTASVDSFPCLEGLVLKFCFKLETIPATFGETPTLETIELHGCLKAESSARQILKEKHDMGNEGFKLLIKQRVVPFWTKRFMDDQRYLSQSMLLQNRTWSSLFKKDVPQKVSHQDIFTSSTVNDCLKKFEYTNVESKRRVKIRSKYNCQSRQAIVGRHLHQGLKLK